MLLLSLTQLYLDHKGTSYPFIEQYLDWQAQAEGSNLVREGGEEAGGCRMLGLPPRTQAMTRAMGPTMGATTRAWGATTRGMLTPTHMVDMAV